MTGPPCQNSAMGSSLQNFEPCRGLAVGCVGCGGPCSAELAALSGLILGVIFEWACVAAAYCGGDGVLMPRGQRRCACTRWEQPRGI